LDYVAVGDGVVVAVDLDSGYGGEECGVAGDVEVVDDSVVGLDVDDSVIFAVDGGWAIDCVFAGYDEDLLMFRFSL
jgi:hypothetical protein